MSPRTDLSAAHALDAEQGDSADDGQEDGRRARRDRNRDAVVDAYLDIVREGEHFPSVADVAARSGVSHRSVFRYFADKDELAHTAVERQLNWIRTLPPLAATPTDPIAARIEAFVALRSLIFEGIGEVGRLSRSLALSQTIIAERLDRSRRQLRQQAAALFAAELEALPDVEATEVLAAIEVLCSFEAYDLLRRSEGMSQARASRTLARALEKLLSA